MNKKEQFMILDIEDLNLLCLKLMNKLENDHDIEEFDTELDLVIEKYSSKYSIQLEKAQMHDGPFGFYGMVLIIYDDKNEYLFAREFKSINNETQMLLAEKYSNIQLDYEVAERMVKKREENSSHLHRWVLP